MIASTWDYIRLYIRSFCRVISFINILVPSEGLFRLATVARPNRGSELCTSSGEPFSKRRLGPAALKFLRVEDRRSAPGLFREGMALDPVGEPSARSFGQPRDIYKEWSRCEGGRTNGGDVRTRVRRKYTDTED